jgi:zona occludens toxin (predicted ATPase)
MFKKIVLLFSSMAAIVSGVYYTSAAHAVALLNGTTDPVTTQTTDTLLDVAVVVGAVLSIAVVIFGFMKVKGMLGK